MKSVITVELPQRSYEVAVVSGGLDQLGNWMQPLKLGQKVLLVSNPSIFRRYGERAIAPYNSQGLKWLSTRFRRVNATRPYPRFKNLRYGSGKSAGAIVYHRGAGRRRGGRHGRLCSGDLAAGN